VAMVIHGVRKRKSIRKNRLPFSYLNGIFDAEKSVKIC
jgi:hypothetical protein